MFRVNVRTFELCLSVEYGSLIRSIAMQAKEWFYHERNKTDREQKQSYLSIPPVHIYPPKLITFVADLTVKIQIHK